MNTTQKRKILSRIRDLERDVSELKRCRMEIALNGYASATMSSGGGSKSYTRLNLSDISRTIESMNREIASFRSMLVDGGLRIRSVLHVYG